LPSLLETADEKGVKTFGIAVRPTIVDDTPIAKYHAVHEDSPLNELTIRKGKNNFYGYITFKKKLLS
jgi:hypothetical protein